MHLNNKMFGIGRRIGHLLAAFALGAILGFTIFIGFLIILFLLARLLWILFP